MYEYDTYKTEDCPLKIKKIRKLPDISITSPEITAKYMRENFALEEKTEEFLYLICLNNKNEGEGVFLVSRGTVNMSCASPAEILKRVLMMNSPNFIILHNHPSGNVTPSMADKNVTDRVKKLAEEMGLSLLDSIIVGAKDFYSFSEH